MQIIVAGPGALGCLLASILLRGNSSKNNISLLDHNSNRARNISKAGIFYHHGDSNINYAIHAHSNLERLQHADAVFLCVKSYDIEETLNFCRPLLQEGTLLIFMQNGIAHLRENLDFGRATPVYGTTTEGATCIGPGHIRHAGVGSTYLGFLHSQQDKQTEQLQKIIDLLAAGGMTVSRSSSIYKRLWEKLFINIGINALTAIYDCPNGELLTIKDATRMMGDAITEAQEVARAEGIAISSPLEKTRNVCRATAENISSMLQDVRNKRKTEIDAINGAVLEKAAKHNIAAPVNRLLVQKVKEIESTYQ